MALEPQLILLDEPMAGMNFEEKEDMARYIVDLNEEFGMTVMMIEHDMDIALELSDMVTVLHYGRVIADDDDDVRSMATMATTVTVTMFRSIV